MHKPVTFQPPASSPQGLQDCLQKAANSTASTFDALLTKGLKSDTPLAREMRALMRQNFDWKHENFSVKKTINELKEDGSIYQLIAKQSNTVDQFFDAMHAVAQGQIDQLTFLRNNHPEALLRRDQFCRFLQTSVEHLRKHGHLADDDDRLEQLMNGYDMSINGYELMRERVSEYSNAQYASIFELAAIQEAHESGEHGEPDEERINDRMEKIYKQITKEAGLSSASDALIPPAYFYLADMAYTIAVKQARRELPHDRVSEALKMRVAERQTALMNEALSTPHDPGELWQLEKPENVLLRAQAKAFGQPLDFHELLKRSAKEAGKTMMAALPRLLNDAQPLLATVARAKGHQTMQMEGVPIYMPQQLEEFCQRHAHGMTMELGSTHTMDDVIVALDQDAEQVLKECIVGMHHPAEILAHRHYAEALGKSMAQHYRAAGLPTQEIRAQFDAVAEKYEHAYAANMEAARWCMVWTDKAYANFGVFALALMKAKTGKTYGELTDDDANHVAQAAERSFMQAAQDRHLPDAWCGSMFMPLFYRRALDQVYHEIRKDWHLHHTGMFADIIVLPEHEDALHQAAKETLDQAVRQQASERIVPLLERTVGMFSHQKPDMNGWPSELPEDPKEHAPYIDSRTLQQAMAFFEQGRGRGTSH